MGDAGFESRVCFVFVLFFALVLSFSPRMVFSLRSGHRADIVAQICRAKLKKYIDYSW